MPNPIKYSTGSETLALKKGNFYIGTGDVGKGPSDTTGFYQGISPSSGGYVIYMNKVGAPGGLSYHNAPTDAELISFTNSLAGQSYTTVNECLVYFAGQTDKVCVNRDYEGIVTDGLIFNLDAGFTPSYPRSGTTWYDLSGNSNDVTLLNGPTFNLSGSGAISFDGSDDNANISFNEISSNSGSIEVWVSRGSETTNAFVFAKVGTSTNRYYLRQPSSNTMDAVRGNPLVNASFGTINVDTIYNLTMTWDNSNVYAYTNGILKDSKSYTNPGTSISDGQIGAGPGNNMNMNLSIFKMYNRTLSPQEILQNYNAQKGRFGL